MVNVKIIGAFPERTRVLFPASPPEHFSHKHCCAVRVRKTFSHKVRLTKGVTKPAGSIGINQYLFREPQTWQVSPILDTHNKVASEQQLHPRKTMR